MSDVDDERILAVLGRPFNDQEVKRYTDPGKKQTFSYITARQVMERLDEAVGPLGWSATYRTPAGYEGTGAVECTITIAGVSKTDVGYPNAPIGATNKSGRPMSDEPLKDAYSDALKRAAVHWGIGRHLYEEKPRSSWRSQDDGREVNTGTGELRERPPDAAQSSAADTSSQSQDARPASASQKASIAKISGLLNKPETGEGLNSEQAAARIRDLSDAYNRSRGRAGAQA